MHMRQSAFLRFGIICLIAGLIGGAGCSRKQAKYIESPTSTASEIRVAPNLEGAKASTGGIASTVTPSLNPQVLANALPEDDSMKPYTASVAEEKMNPVPMQDGTRSDFSTLTKTFTKSGGDGSLVIKASLTDTRSIPVLTAFIDSYSEYSNDQAVRKKLTVQGETAWLTYQQGVAGGYGSVVMLYRGRFLIQVDGNLGVTQEDLIIALNAYHFDQLK